MLLALLVLSWILIAATLIPFLRWQVWWIRVFDFPRFQVAFLGLACLLVWIWVPEGEAARTATLAALTICVVYQSWELSTYTRLRAQQSLASQSGDRTRRIRLLIANVLMSNRNTAEYLALIEENDPDIVALAEANEFWEEQFRQIESEYPFSMKCPLENTYGLLLYSKLPLSEQQIRFRVQEDIPSFTALVSLRSRDVVELHCIHPRPPQVGVDTEGRDAELILVAREVKDSPRPVIVTGDLNDVAWSHTTRLFLRLSGLLDPRVGRMFCNTFHANYPWFRWPLDHLFHSRAFRLVRLQRLRRTASDHFAVLVELSFEPEVREEQDRPLPDSEDMKEAAEKVDKSKETGAADSGTEIADRTATQ